LLVAAAGLFGQGAHEATVDLRIGKKVFESQCALCHGQDGSGGRGPNLRRPKLPKAATDEELRRVISNGLAPEMPGAWQLSVREVASVAGYVREMGKIAVEIVPGNPFNGETLFAGRGCSGCHIINGKGNSAGPELSNTGARRSAAHLRESLLQPQADLPDGFLVVEAELAGGGKVRGVKLNEDLFSIQVRDGGGRVHSFQKSALKALTRKTGESSMPAFTSLPANEIDDLVAYLASLRGNQ